MHVETLVANLAGAATLHEVERVFRWSLDALRAGFADVEAVDAVFDAARARRAELKGGTERPRSLVEAFGQRHGTGTRFPPKRVQRSPDRRRSLERKRRIAAAGGLPPNLAHHFTQGQVAVLTVVADQVREHGACDLPLDRIAAIAGVSRQWAKVALRIAVRLRLISVEQRPRPGRKNLTNVITIASEEWRAWIVRGPRRGIGASKVFPSPTKVQNLNRNSNGKKGFREKPRLSEDMANGRRASEAWDTSR